MNDKNNPKKIIVTGGYGFIGSHMMRRLVGDGHEVVHFVKKGSNPERIADLLPHITSVEEDLRDKERLTKLIEEIKPNGVFHFAASNIQAGVTSSDDDVISTNVTGVVNLLNSLATTDYDFFINIGTFLECGVQDHALRETDFPQPPNVYALSKLGGTLYGQAMGKINNKPVVTLRLMTPYGPGMQKGRLVREVAERALKNEPIQLTSPTVGRDFLYIDDLIELCLEAASKARTIGGEIFYMGSGAQTNLGALADMVLKKTGSTSQVNWGGFKKVAYDSDIWVADMTKTFGAFSWRPKVSLEDGLDKVIEWAKTLK